MQAQSLLAEAVRAILRGGTGRDGATALDSAWQNRLAVLNRTFAQQLARAWWQRVAEPGQRPYSASKWRPTGPARPLPGRRGTLDRFGLYRAAMRAQLRAIDSGTAGAGVAPGALVAPQNDLGQIFARWQRAIEAAAQRRPPPGGQIRAPLPLMSLRPVPHLVASSGVVEPLFGPDSVADDPSLPFTAAVAWPDRRLSVRRLYLEWLFQRRQAAIIHAFLSRS